MHGPDVAGELPAPDDGGAWELVRQDDNGNVVAMHRYATETDAHTARRVYESRGHRQLYSVRKRTSYS